MKKLVECGYCQKQIERDHWLIRPDRPNYCSNSCHTRHKKELGIFGPQSLGPEILKLVEHEYINCPTTACGITQKFNVSRSFLFYHAKKNGWKKFSRARQNRAIYRRVAERKAARKLLKHEHVHHIDGDNQNNAQANLHVFDGAKSHGECHGSLEAAAFQLFRRGLITFNESTGRYSLPAS